MPQDYHFEFPLPNGLHARPASLLEAAASRFTSAISLHCGRNGNLADLHSVLGMISADIRHGDPCVLHVEGADEDAAFATLLEYLSHEFPHCDEALPVESETPNSGKLPRVLAELGVERWWSGQKVSGTLAIAPIVRLDGLTLADGFNWPPVESKETELQRLTSALAAVGRDFERQIAAATDEAADILRAQAGILADPSLFAQVAQYIENHSQTAGEAVIAVTDAISAKLRAGSVYLQERVADLQDISARLLTALHGENAIRRAPLLTSPAILVSTDLTPGQFLAVDHRYLSGIVLEQGGATSHTAILARAAGVPMLVGVKGANSLTAGTVVILDARRGVLIAMPSDAMQRFYQREADRFTANATTAAALSHRPGQSADGVALPIHANVSTAADVATAMEHGAEGIGLFRTELIFMNRENAPAEEEQLAIYSDAIRHAAGRPLVIRTLDIGGDKPVPWLNLPMEANPFLGQRGVRLYQRFPALIRTQLRALIRASTHGPVKIMVPMVACAEEMADFRMLVDEIRAELLSEELPIGDDIAIGAMLEVPSAVFALPEISHYADFFSVGSNDLAQYFLAVDRGNPAIAGLGTWRHPSFLRLLQMAVRSSRAAKRPIGLCGDLASQPEALPLLLGMGFDSISLGAAGIAATKVSLSRLTQPAAGRRLDLALEAADRADVDSALSTMEVDPGNNQMLERELFQADAIATNKAEAINELVALAEAAGRTRNAVALEEAVWAREETYPTNFGHGFAVPHCHSSLVSTPVIALLRLAKPVKWTADDDSLVHIALLLAMPSGENKAHLQIFARLSRMIMREEFRSALETAPDADALLTVLSDALAPAIPKLTQNPRVSQANANQAAGQDAPKPNNHQPDPHPSIP